MFNSELDIIYLIYLSDLLQWLIILTDCSLYKKKKKDRIMVIYIFSVFRDFLWGAFEQAGASLLFLPNRQTDRTFIRLGNASFQMVQFKSIILSFSSSIIFTLGD